MWIWVNKLSPESHAGTIIFQASRHNWPEIAVLGVVVPVGDTYGNNLGHYSLLSWKDTLKVTHRGAVGDWVYHAKEPAYVTTAPIPPGHIKVLGLYNILDCLKWDARSPSTLLTDKMRRDGQPLSVER